jgi:TusA-related sulfurtransferase
MSVAEVLAAHPPTLAVFIAQHQAFGRLRNPLLRKMFARLVSVEQAAAIAGIDVADLLAALNAADGVQTAPPELPARPAAPPGPAPDWYDPALVSISLDVRAESSPFALISQATRQLLPGEILSLRNSFEPLPLYELLGRRGFAHWGYRQAEDDWQIFFRHTAASPAEEQPAASAAADATRVVLDNRGLVPPEPMLRTLEALKTLPPAGSLLALTDRQPLFLYEALAEQGYAYQTLESSDHHYRTLITRLAEGT